MVRRWVEGKTDRRSKRIFLTGFNLDDADDTRLMKNPDAIKIENIDIFTQSIQPSRGILNQFDSTWERHHQTCKGMLKPLRMCMGCVSPSPNGISPNGVSPSPNGVSPIGCSPMG